MNEVLGMVRSWEVEGRRKRKKTMAMTKLITAKNNGVCRFISNLCN